MALRLDPGGRTRFSKISMAIIDVLTQVYRDIMQQHVPPDQIFNKVKASLDVFQKLNTDQILILKDARRTKTYADFDITLLYILFRNICTNIPSPTKKWGTPPETGDVGIGDDIERIRMLRNDVYGHVRSASMSRRSFEKSWRMISDICQRLQSHTGGSYTRNLENILEGTIDEDQEDLYIEKLKFDGEKDKSVLKKLSSLHSDVKDLKSKMTDTNKCCCQLIVKVNVLTRTESTEAQDNVDRMMETLKQTLNRMVEFIDKETKIRDISMIEDNIIEFLDSSSKKEDIVFINDLLDKFQENIDLAFKDQNNVRIGIMSKFARFVIVVKKKYQAKFRVDIGSLIITFIFESLQGFQKFKDDWKSCVIQVEVKKVVHCEEFLCLFMINKDDMKVELEEFKDIGPQVSTVMDPLTSSESKDNTEVNLESTPLYPGCVSHAKERCEMFCRNCDIPICHTCLASDQHFGHKYSKILDILDEKKDLLKKRQIELKETICPTYQEIAAGEQNRIKKMEKEYGDLSTGLAIHEDYLHKEVDKLFNKTKAKLNEMKNNQLYTLQNHLEDINKKLIEIDEEIDGIDKALRSNDISTILQVLHSSKIDQHKKLPNKLVPSAPKFTPGKIQEEKLLKFVGVLSPFNITTEKHGYSIHVKAAQDPLEFGYFSPITSNSTEISSPNAVSLDSQEVGSSPQVSKKLSPGPGSSPHVTKKSSGTGSSPQVTRKLPGVGSSPQDEYPSADEQQSPDYGFTTM